MPRKRIRRNRYFWYQSVEDMIKSYYKLKAEDTDYTDMYFNAINSAIDWCDSQEAGALMKKAVYMSWIDNTHTVSGVSLALNVSESTVRKWKRKFLLKVAENVGLSKRNI